MYLLALGSWYNSFLVFISKIWQVEFSSTIASFPLDADKSKHLIALFMDINWTGNGLSRYIFKTCPFFKPRSSPSRSGGPPTTFERWCKKYFAYSIPNQSSFLWFFKEALFLSLLSGGKSWKVPPKTFGMFFSKHQI